MKIFTIFGTRPEAIKMAPVIKAAESSTLLESVVCVTAQHREMLDQVIRVFDIEPDYDLNIMSHGQTLSEITTKALSGLEEIVLKVKPDVILVHGDTTTTFVGALTGFYHRIPVGHVEAGLRTWNKYSPWPEEINRQMVDNIATFYFAPTEYSKQNLLKEGKADESIFVTGNTVIDSLKTTVSDCYSHEVLDWVGDDRMILLTTHRRENLGQPMENIFNAVLRIVKENINVKVVFPIHPNPQIRNIAKSIFQNEKRIKIIEPLDVIDFHNFLNRCFLVLTDSGGIQEEASALGKPLLVLRDTTERPEGIQAGVLRLVGTEEDKIYNEGLLLLNDSKEYDSMSNAKNPYGDGKASERIIKVLIDEMC